MELVPILSTIILVGTIATFILAVAAYILYKIRERRSGREQAPEETRREEPHVLVQPAERPALEARRDLSGEFARDPWGRPETRVRPHSGTRPGVQARRVSPARPDAYSRPESAEPEPERLPGRHESLFWEYTDEGFVPVRTDSGTGGAFEEQESSDSDRAAWT